MAWNWEEGGKKGLITCPNDSWALTLMGYAMTDNVHWANYPFVQQAANCEFQPSSLLLTTYIGSDQSGAISKSIWCARAIDCLHSGPISGFIGAVARAPLLRALPIGEGALAFTNTAAAKPFYYSRSGHKNAQKYKQIKCDCAT